MLQIRGNTYRKLNTSPGDEDISRLCEHNFLPVRGFGQRKYSSKQSIGFTVTLICRLSCYRVCPGFSNARSENFAESVCFLSLSLPLFLASRICWTRGSSQRHHRHTWFKTINIETVCTILKYDPPVFSIRHFRGKIFALKHRETCSFVFFPSPTAARHYLVDLFPREIWKFRNAQNATRVKGTGTKCST